MEKSTHAQSDIINGLKRAYPEISDDDFIQMAAHGVSPEDIARQLSIFHKGIAKASLDRPAVKGDGIRVLSETQHEDLAAEFDKVKDGRKLGKFVPASGAASRMFKFLNEFRSEFDLETETVNGYINRKGARELEVFLAGLEKFPFYDQVRSALRRREPDFETFTRDRQVLCFIDTMLSEKALDFANQPKGVLPFHKYFDHVAVPVEEHLNEGAYYAASDRESYIHFTVSEQHRRRFEDVIAQVGRKIAKQSGNAITVDFSYQNKSTDSISVDARNRPCRHDGELLFRPGGHGALIHNLGALDADIVFIKNIDNVIQNHIGEIALYKKSLAGLLISIQQNVFDYLDQLDGVPTDALLSEIRHFVESELSLSIIEDFDKFTPDNKIAYLREKLHRPIRVCGMVRNEGEPGGGPFWVRSPKGTLSLQIVESAQVDHDNKAQLAILKSATHFNPVDLVCGIRDHKGHKFDLTQFVDPDAGFIVEKNKHGKIVKSYELPGLWNGAMAKWITVFVEVPLITFNPVKTVNDLLKPAHQPQL